MKTAHPLNISPQFLGIFSPFFFSQYCTSIFIFHPIYYCLPPLFTIPLSFLPSLLALYSIAPSFSIHLFRYKFYISPNFFFSRTFSPPLIENFAPKLMCASIESIECFDFIAATRRETPPNTPQSPPDPLLAHISPYIGDIGGDIGNTLVTPCFSNFPIA